MSENVLRWKQRFENYEKAYKLLSKYAKQTNYTELERAGVIQLFETCFELSWKLMKDYLDSEGFIVNSPRSSIKIAEQAGIIETSRIWLDALSSRNLITHTYDEDTANELIQDINNLYLKSFENLYQNLLKEM